jgi:hypothetical protein
MKNLQTAFEVGNQMLICVFRRSRPGIPSEGGRPFPIKPAGDSNDPSHL